MAVSITSITGNAVIGYTITVSGANSDTFIDIRRTDLDGYYPIVAVRGGDYATPTGSTMVFFDYEAPINRNIQYTAAAFNISNLVTPTSSATNTPSVTSFPVGFAIITQVLDTSQRVAGSILDFKTTKRAARVLGHHEVLGRANPVIITDVMGGRTGTLTMTNMLMTGQDYGDGVKNAFDIIQGEWDTIFNDGSTLLFRSERDDSGFSDFYFKAMAVNEERISILGGTPLAWVQYAIDFEQVDRPLTSIAGLGLGTWNDVFMANTTWAEVNSVHANWLDVLSNPSL